jgi:hypothetical protein
MDQKRLQSIVTWLSRYELNGQEKQFVARAREHFTSKGHLTEQQESILEGLYGEKIKWAKLGLISEKGAIGNCSRNGTTRTQRKLPLNTLRDHEGL